MKSMETWSSAMLFWRQCFEVRGRRAAGGGERSGARQAAQNSLMSKLVVSDNGSHLLAWLQTLLVVVICRVSF